jgi:hypothetical protein
MGGGQQHPQLTSFLPECRDPRLSIGVALGIGQQSTDLPHSIWLLRACREGAMSPQRNPSRQ